MKIAYNVKNGKVFRVLADNESYYPGVAHSLVTIPLGNDDLLNAIADIDQIIKDLEGATGWAHAKKPLDLALVVGRLAEAGGMTPVTPAAEVTP